MSVETEADKCLEVTKKSIEDAIRNLSKVVVDRVPGSNDFTVEARVKHRGMLSELLYLRDMNYTRKGE